MFKQDYKIIKPKHKYIFDNKMKIGYHISYMLNGVMHTEIDTDDLAHDSILFSAAGWPGPDGAWTEPPGVHIRAITRR